MQEKGQEDIEGALIVESKELGRSQQGRRNPEDLAMRLRIRQRLENKSEAWRETSPTWWRTYKVPFDKCLLKWVIHVK